MCFIKYIYFILHNQIHENHTTDKKQILLKLVIHLRNLHGLYSKHVLAKIYFFYTSAYYKLVCYQLKKLKSANLLIKTDIIGLRENENSEYSHNLETHFFRKKTPKSLTYSCFQRIQCDVFFR